jgi:putative pyoverdin transport system ATP-binding/permease protein
LALDVSGFVDLTPLLALVRPLRGQLILAVLAGAASGVASMLLVALINAALMAERDALAGIGVKFAVVSLLALLCRWLSEERFARLGQTGLAALRREMSRKIATLTYREFERRGAASFNAALTEDTNTVAHACAILPGVIINACLIAGSFAYMAYLSPGVFAWVAGVLLVGVLAYAAVESLALGTLRLARRAEDDVFAGFGSLLQGGKELRLHAPRRRAFLRHGLGAAIERVRSLRSRGLSISIAASSVGSFLFFVVIGVVAFALSRWWGLERAVVSGYALVFLYLMFPLESLLGSLPMLERARIAVERLEALTGTVEGDAERSTVQAPAGDRPALAVGAAAEPFQSLRLDGVTHRYRGESRDDEFVLGPIHLELRPGEVTFLIGGNGSGKTTLAKLLVGLYAPERGRVWLNGCEVSEATREGHRARCSAVFSDFHLFDSLWGLDAEETLAQARAGLERLKLAERVRLDAGRFSTTALSQGQRKRLAFLVACLEERPVVLFDEWAADQDPASKDVFYRQLVPGLARMGKAVVVVTHDDRYFELGDQCLKLEFGQLVPARPSALDEVGTEPGAGRHDSAKSRSWTSPQQ